MQELFHIIIPAALLLAVFPKTDKRLLLMLLPLAVLPDIDFVAGHRGLGHSLVFLFATLAAVYLLSRRNKDATLISAFFLASHFLLDSGGDMMYFWPVFTQFVSVHLDLLVNNSTLALSWMYDSFIQFHIAKPERICIPNGYSAVFLTEDIMMVALLAVLLAAHRISGHRRKAAGLQAQSGRKASGR